MIEKDLDFENFKVEADRATVIRDRVRLIKDELDLEGLRLLVSELGTENRDEENGFLPNIVKEQKSLQYIVPPGHPADGFQLFATGTDFHIRRGSRSLLEVSYLPKGGDFIVFHLEESEFESLQNLKELLKEEIKAARAKKSQRSAAFKAKFNESSSEAG